MIILREYFVKHFRPLYELSHFRKLIENCNDDSIVTHSRKFTMDVPFVGTCTELWVVLTSKSKKWESRSKYMFV